MRAIFKYGLKLGLNLIEMPSGAEVKTVADQFGAVTMWAEVDSDAEPEKRTFDVYGTGLPIPAGLEYVGTAFCGPFVWHVYEQA